MHFPDTPTLTREETNNLLKKTLNGDDEARERLIACNYKLVMTIVKKYAKVNTDYDEFFSDGIVGLIKAIDSFDINKIGEIAFSSYATICIRNEILMDIRTKNKKSNDVASFNDVVGHAKHSGEEMYLEETLTAEEPSLISCLIKEEYYKKLYVALSKLSEREQIVIKKRYGLTSWEDIKNLDIFSDSFGNQSAIIKDKEIAQILHTGRSNICKLHTHALGQLKEQLNNLGISIDKSGFWFCIIFFI